ESPIIFFGDMCGEENTAQAASVEFERRRRSNYARSRLQPLCQKGILFDRQRRKRVAFPPFFAYNSGKGKRGERAWKRAWR
ncbi:MAG: hypothetical protein U0O13_02540, partial [Oscillospiraceae bacterium]